MNKIVLLPEQVANQIAAGEVVERPANIVKELLENSLDAGATEINVFFKKGGKTYICVRDNGVGMNEVDAEMCFKRHATSKLKCINDLLSINSFGFRGEALPSIASVSNVTLQTKHTDSECGVELYLSGGFLQHKKPSPVSVGSTFIVENLFFNVPARRKFLKADSTEAAHIINWVRLYALAYPSVFFSLNDGDREIFASPKCATLEDRVNEIWPRRDSKEWIKLDSSDCDFSASGLISKPGEEYSTSNEIFVFVNDRPVYSSFMMGVIRNAYRQFLPPKTYPAIFLFIKARQSDVDINVHPTKREVRFKNEAMLKTFVSNSLDRALAEFSCSQSSFFDNSIDRGSNVEFCAPHRPYSTFIDSNQYLSKRIAPLNIAQGNSDAIQYSSTAIDSCAMDCVCSDECVKKSADSANTAEIAGNWRFLAFFKKFALFDAEGKLICFDCNAAIKRINYDRMCKNIDANSVSLQRLLIPKTFQLQPILSDVLQKNIQFLNNSNLCKVRYLRDDTFLLECIPNFSYKYDENSYLDTLIDALSTYSNDLVSSSAKTFLASLCKNLTSNANFDEKSLLALRNDLALCDNCITAPDGTKIWHSIMQ